MFRKVTVTLLVNIFMNILFVTSKFGLMSHIDCGAANRTTMLVMALAQLGHVDVISFYKVPIHSTIPDCDVIYNTFIPNDNLTLKDKIIRKLNLIFRPWHPNGFYSINKQRDLVVEKLYNKKKYDIVVCRYIDNVVSCGLMKYADKLVVDVDDNLSSAYKRDFQNKKFQHVWSKPFALLEIKAVNLMSKWLLKQVRLSFFSNILDSPYDKSVFLHNVPALTGDLPKITNQTPIRMLLVGWLDFFPNKYGVLHFVHNIFPLIREKVTNAEIKIVGKSKDDNLFSELRSQSGVNAPGFVEDLQMEYSNCRVVITALYHGSGSSVKFIEGIMMNRPVVSTPFGARGFDTVFKAGEHYLLAESDQEFADKVVELLTSIDKGNEMARKAREVADKNFSQERFFEIVKNNINSTFASVLE